MSSSSSSSSPDSSTPPSTPSSATSNFTPNTPVSLQIRKIIFDNYNDTDDLKFTNDEIFEILKKNGDIDPTWIIDDIEPEINALCDSKMVRNIAQNFTTIWLKLFEKVDHHTCLSCNSQIYIGAIESQICPNCKKSLN